MHGAQVVILTTPTIILPAQVATPGSPQFEHPYPMSGCIYSVSAGIFLGGSGVTGVAPSGFALPAGVLIAFDVLGIGPEGATDDTLYGICPAGTNPTVFLIRRGRP